MRRSRYEKGIAYRVDWRRVDDDPIKFPKQTLDNVLELLVTEKLGRIWRATTSRQDDKIVVLGCSDSVVQSRSVRSANLLSLRFHLHSATLSLPEAPEGPHR